MTTVSRSLGRNLTRIGSAFYVASLLALAYGVATVIDQDLAVRVLDSYLPFLCILLVVGSSLIGTVWCAMNPEAQTAELRSTTFSTLGVSIAAFLAYVLLTIRMTA